MADGEPAAKRARTEVPGFFAMLRKAWGGVKSGDRDMMCTAATYGEGDVGGVASGSISEAAKAVWLEHLSATFPAVEDKKQEDEEDGMYGSPAYIATCRKSIDIREWKPGDKWTPADKVSDICAFDWETDNGEQAFKGAFDVDKCDALAVAKVGDGEAYNGYLVVAKREDFTFAWVGVTD
eukprot:CAMPEP_0117500614 /NCGR_PEP_ID=MMETSP0784-20121206/22865_1 /TAXON_ID=39447 /ORGANISM="" /LENGTH=179 /DNA_ID=CAMNT_0005295825 /DNA_START=68 /DNA_END=607 /DNA_ORIENTATION=-